MPLPHYENHDGALNAEGVVAPAKVDTAPVAPAPATQTNSGGSNGSKSSSKKKGGKAPAAKTSDQERRKGIPWTEEEHRLFLLGLQKLGKVSSGGYCLSELSSRRQSRFFYPGGARTARRRREARDRTSRSPGLFRSISASRRPFRPVAAMENLFGRQRPFVFARGTGGTLRALRCSTRQRSA